MKQKLAIIGASYLQLPLVHKARELGLETICFAWEAGAVCKSVADRFFPISILEKERILEACRELKIDGVSSIRRFSPGDAGTPGLAPTWLVKPTDRSGSLGVESLV